MCPPRSSAWRTVDGLAARRVLRTDLAELGHVRFGVLNADRWVEKILPILNGKIDALDLTAESSASLRPTVEKALYRLLDQVKEQMSPEARAGRALRREAVSPVASRRRRKRSSPT